MIVEKVSETLYRKKTSFLRKDGKWNQVFNWLTKGKPGGKWVNPPTEPIQLKESYNLLMSMTALDLPPDALKKYRPLEAIRRRRAKMSAEISKRRRR
ncbi:MAG TPA: hypothetical protein VJM08_15575, partial [Anaerolineales bacterium]|nr:hypothetical protein [Anaerolineales bacterium]